eukprot:SM000127S26632  [mRNA]  locus=s127:184091:185264:- [translate_table: standard]
MRAQGQGPDLQLRPQVDAPDLGVRMLAALQEVFQGGASSAIVIGTDVPDLDEHIMMSAFSALEVHQVVFGPAEDGGYYLLGIRQPFDALFEGIPWSMPDVLQCSLVAAAGAGLSVAPLCTLPTLADIDTADDLRRWLAMRHTALAAMPGSHSVEAGENRDSLAELAVEVLEEANVLQQALAENGYTL